jgi:uncharacterized protein YbjT (DUF2867 family)
MKIVVVGGTGLIGSQVVAGLQARGHEAVAAAPSTGVNTVTGDGLDEVLRGADVVVDVANSPSFEDHAVLEFFRTAGRTLLAAEAKAGVRHHVALSVVGADGLPDSGYLRAKVVQEELIEQAGIPYTVIRATQFFEFLRPIADSMTQDGVVVAPPALFQPIAAVDVAAAVTDVAVDAPANGQVEIAGPDAIGLDELLRRVLAADGDARHVEADVHARYFGTEVTDSSLVPQGAVRLGRIDLDEWLASHAAATR